MADNVASIWLGARRGLIAWAAYGTVETFHLILLPWILLPANDFVPLHPGLTILLQVSYAVIGAMLGALVGWAWPKASAGQLRVVCTGTVILAYAIADFTQAERLWYGLLRSPLLLAATLLSLRADRLGRILGGLGNPWTASLLILGVPGVLEALPGASRTVKVATIAAYLVLVFLTGTFIESRLKHRDQIRWVRGRFIKVALATTGALFWLAALSVEQKPLLTSQAVLDGRSGRPNVILISCDTVRADHMSTYGYSFDTTPNLRRLTKGAVLYRNSYSSGDMTLSSQAAIFTGLYPIRHGAHYGDRNPAGRPLEQSRTTLAEILSSHGYLTAAVVANPGFLSPGFGLAQGFHYYDHRSAVPFLSYRNREHATVRQLASMLLTHFSTPWEFDQICRRAGDINDEVYRQLSRLKESRKPFFLFINYMDAHWPYIPPAPFHKRFPGIDESFTLRRYFKLLDRVLAEKATVSQAERRHLLSQYDGAIAYIDFEIDRLLSRLRAMNLYEDTLIVITSDHGEAFGRRNLMEHGVSTYQDQVYVPLIIKFPQGRAETRWHGTTREEPVGGIDLMPSILDTVGVDVPKGLDGRSLLRPEVASDRLVYSESYPRGSLKKYPRFRRIERSAVSGRWKLISSTSGKCELYDLRADPREERNVCQKETLVSAALQRGLTDWLRTAGSVERNTAPLDRQTLETLRSLGYVQ